MLDLGVCGKPNCGKSTFFSAATLVDVPIADYPFTTIDANRGIAYVRATCPCKERGVKCQPKNSKCIDGVRLIPTTIIDVAGLVPGAHEGRGLGNKFLDDLRNASAIIQVVDASGRTDLEGKPIEGGDPTEEVKMLEEELTQWMAAILMRELGIRKKTDIEGATKRMSGLGIMKDQISETCKKQGKDPERIEFEEKGELVAFARALRRISKPILIAANKIDVRGAEENYRELVSEFGEDTVVRCYAEGELALRRAAKAGIIKYVPGAKDFEIRGGDEKQREALEKIRGEIKGRGTGVQRIIDEAVFGLLNYITVYPVEDEAKLSDRSGNVLPDAILLKKGGTAVDLAGKIHSELADKFICAIDVKTGRKVGREHVLKDGDVIRIVKRR
ncbi:redox-regulated ATPase YchF [Candidatus Micrarchaeota archaeon]|nr:MAG: redox-regulated ATPase YchF [Candidatus Micrarchaeota archaeon]